MAKFHVDPPGLFTTDVVVVLSDSEAKAIAAGGGVAAVAHLGIPPPFNLVVSAIIAAAAADIAIKNHGNGVRVIVQIVTVLLPAIVVTGHSVLSL